MGLERVGREGIREVWRLIYKLEKRAFRMYINEVLTPRDNRSAYLWVSSHIYNAR